MIDAALYGPGGFYTGGGGAGRTRDYLTSPSIGPLFGAVVARAVDDCWRRRRRPDPWIVVEAGAGSGDLAAAVLAARPECAAALRYIAVEISPALRAAAANVLPVDDPAQVLGPLIAGETPHHKRGLGPLVAILAEMPTGPFPGMVIANELLDNLPFDIYERTSSGWLEVRVTVEDGTLSEVLVPGVDVHLAALAPDAPMGARVPWQATARAWLRNAVDTVEGGDVLLFDYGRSTSAMAAAGGWLRTYRSGGRAGRPLKDLGMQDITTDVAVDQLGLVDHPLQVTDQATWLRQHGLDELAAAAGAAWQARAAAGDLEALRARSRVGEAAALRDPNGPGAFVVIESGERSLSS